MAEWHEGYIYLGNIILTPEQCGGLAMLLNYIAFAEKLPKPEGE